MIQLRRKMLVAIIIVSLAAGVGLGGWGAAAFERGKGSPLLAQVQAPIVPAALPVPTGTFAQVAAAVGAGQRGHVQQEAARAPLET